MKITSRDLVFHVSDLWHLEQDDVVEALVSMVPVNGTFAEQQLVKALEAYLILRHLE